MHKFKAATIAILSAGVLAAQSPCNCSGESLPVGPTFKVYGRLSSWNGNPALRIWISGTKRILGVREGTKLPKTLRPHTTSFETEIWADFEVCPLTKEQPGVMQIVCISSASNIVVRHSSHL